MKKNIFLSLISVMLVITFSCNQEKAEKQNPFLTSSKKVFQYTTADTLDLRISLTDSLSFNKHDQPVETQTVVFVDPQNAFQTFMGIGGAITDASAETFAKLPENKKEEFVKAYYDTKNGIGYNLARTHINSCDFSSESYTYVKEGDAELKSFDVAHDKQYRIPLIQKAIAASGGNLPLYVSPWSPPSWMKTNNDMLHGGKLKPEFDQSWANYYIKFIETYEAEGIPVWGLTVQNEPMATQTWESCLYTADEERDFVKNFLGPTLYKAGMQDKKLIVWDHNRDLMYQRASSMFSDKDASKYVWGLGFHWYEDWSGGDQMFDNVSKVHESWPDKNLIFTEGCTFPFAMEKVNDWSLGERYGRSMINDFNHGTVAWTDWNILVDESGGPNHVGNFCMAPIVGDTRTGELFYTSSYYYIGHFSKFIKPGARRVQASPSRSNLLSTAFLNEDGSLVVIVMNNTSKDSNYHLWIENNSVPLTAFSHSISTLIVK
jgi:glucosylceramidase